MLNPDAFFPVLKRVAGILDQYGIRFVLTGGLVAVYYSEPRLTQDADLVVDAVPLKANLDAFVQTLIEGEYVCDAGAIREAVQRGRMFQVFDSREAIKVDFYPRELVPGALERAVWVQMTSDLKFPISSRPDIVASKLVWISKGSHKSRRDVRQLMLGATEDEARMAREFAEELGQTELLAEVLAEPDEIDA